MNITDKKWSSRLLKMAYEVSSWSKDESTKVGSVITTENGSPISWGFNGIPMGINDDVPERNIRPAKYKWVAHAEVNAMDLAPIGDLTNCVMFVTHFPCSTCARSIIQKKIKTILVDENNMPAVMPERWREDTEIAMEMLKEAEIEIIPVRIDLLDNNNK